MVSDLTRLSRIVVSFASVLLLLGVASCGDSPEKVFERMQKAAREGNAEVFAKCFNEESEPFARALISLQRTQASAAGPLSRPLEMIAKSTIETVKTEGELAYLTVRGGQERDVLVFKKEKAGWRLDIQLTERRNAGN
jgi:hypothetical protein